MDTPTKVAKILCADIVLSLIATTDDPTGSNRILALMKTDVPLGTLTLLRVREAQSQSVEAIKANAMTMPQD